MVCVWRTRDQRWNSPCYHVHFHFYMYILARLISFTRNRMKNDHPGLIPLLRVYDSLAGYWSKTGRQIPSSATVYIPMWHSDVRRFVICRTNRAPTSHRFRHLYPALWVPNLLCVLLCCFASFCVPFYPRVSDSMFIQHATSRL